MRPFFDLFAQKIQISDQSLRKSDHLGTLEYRILKFEFDEPESDTAS